MQLDVEESTPASDLLISLQNCNCPVCDIIKFGLKLLELFKLDGRTDEG